MSKDKITIIQPNVADITIELNDDHILLSQKDHPDESTDLMVVELSSIPELIMCLYNIGAGTNEKV